MSPFYAPGNARTRTMQPLSVRFDADLVSPVSSIPSTPTRQSSRSSSQRFYALQSGQPSILNAPPVPQSPARSQPPPTPPANRPTIPAIPPLPPLHRLLTASGNITPTSSNSPDRHFTNLPPPSPPPNVPLPPFPPRKKSHRPAPLREELRQSYLAMPSRMSAAEAVAAGVLLHPAVRENGASTGRVSVGRPVISEDVRRSMYPASMAAAVISPGGGSSGGGTSSVSPLRNEPQDEKRRDAGRWRRWIRAGHLQRHLLAALGEYIGTTAFLVLGIAVTQLIDGIVLPNMDDSTLSLANIVKGAIVAVIFGLSMALATTMFWRISGALFNPAITLSFLLTLSVPPLRTPFLLVAQITASITAAALAYALLPSSSSASSSSSSSVTPLVTSIPAAFAREVFAAVPQVLAALILARDKRRAGSGVPSVLGIAVALGSLIGNGLWGGGNPARLFGRQVVVKGQDSGGGGLRSGQYWGVYWAGPFAGSIVATVLYLIINAIEKALANPEQDWSRSDMQRTSHLSLRREAATAARWRVDPVGRIESSHDYGHGFRSGDADGDGRWRWMSGRRDVEEMI